MTFISEALYKSLKSEQNNLLDVISKLTEKQQALTARIKVDENFLASFDETQQKLEASIATSESQIAQNDNRIDQLKTKTTDVKMAIENEQVKIASLTEKLERAKKEGRPQSEIDALSASIVIAEGNLLDLRKEEASLRKGVDDLKTQQENLNDLIISSNEQVAENEERKVNLVDEGTLADLEKSLTETTEELSVVNEEYSVFKSENQSTINAFEVQDEKRNKLIRVTSNRKIYNRSLPEAENSAIANEDAVLKEVVTSELDIENLSEEETELLNKAVEKARSTSFDPNFLSAEGASDIARAASFSLLPVSQAIKEAAMKGLYSITINVLSDSNIYALEQAGYTVVLTPSRLPEFEIRWDRIIGES